MTNITQVSLVNGVPSVGTGNVSTIDNLIAVGLPISSGLPTGSNTIGAVTLSSGVVNSALLFSNGSYVTNTNPVPVSLSVEPTINIGSVSILSGNNNIGGFMIQDGSGGSNNRVLVAAFHNADNQTLGTAYGLNTGGVAQLLNPIGNIDRQRGTGLDNIPATGISTGIATSAMQFKTFSNNSTGISTGSNSVYAVALSGNVGNVPWKIQSGSVLIIGYNTANQETVIVSSANTTQFTATFTYVHPANTLITGFTYNQGRDAAGENDGASGAGTSVAAGYEYNGGDPSGGNYDRERSINAKGFTQVAISSGGTVGSNSIVIASANTLQPGMKVLLSNNALIGTQTYEAVNIDLSYIPGSTTVPLSSNIVQTVSGGYTFLSYDSFNALGAQLNGFLPFGVGIEEEAIFDPVSGKYFIGRVATSDGMGANNIPAEGVALWNGSTFDRLKGNTTVGAYTYSTLAPGTNFVGNVSVTALPSLVITSGVVNSALLFSNGSYVTNTNPIPISGSLSLGGLSTGTNSIGNVSITSGTITIGTGLPTGANTIGSFNFGTSGVEKWIAGSGQGLTWGSAFSTEINSIANNYAIQSSVVITNGSALDTYMDISISMGSITTIAGAPYLGLYLYPLNQDGTTYGDGRFASAAAGPPLPIYYVGQISLIPSVTQAQTGSFTNILLPPGSFILVLYNVAGATLASSSNVIKYRTYNRSIR